MTINWRSCFTLGLIGGIQGLILYLISQLQNIPTQFFSGALAFVLLFGFFIEFSWHAKSKTRLLQTSAVLAFIFAIIYTLRYDNNEHLIGLNFVGFILLILAIYIVNIFHEVYHAQGRFDFPYTQLYEYCWNTPSIIVFALALSSVCFFLLSAWSALFNLIGISIFKTIFTSPLFLCVENLFVIGFGIALAQSWQKILSSTRQLNLTVFACLLPILAFFCIIFIASYLIQILTGKLEGKEDIIYYFSFVIFFTILFINNVYQDGIHVFTYPRWIQYTVNIFIIILPIYAALLMYDFFKKLHSFDLEALQLFTIYALLSLYTFTYAIGTIFSLYKKQMPLAFLPPVNKTLSIVILAVAFVLNVPFISPGDFLKPQAGTALEHYKHTPGVKS